MRILFHKILKISRKEYLNSLDKFREEKYLSLQPRQEILEWFKQYGNKFYHIVLTSVSRKCAEKSVFWIIKYFGDWIQSVNFVYSEREDDNSIKYFNNKSEWIEWFGKVDYFIDDNEKSLKEAKILNPSLITFCPKQLWNSGEDIEDILDKLCKGV